MSDKIQVATSIDADELEIVQAVAGADISTQARILRMAIKAGLPQVAREVMGEEYVRQKFQPKKDEVGA